MRTVTRSSPQGTLDEVLDHVRQVRGRDLVVLPAAMDEEMSGAWCQTPDIDFIVYPVAASPLRRDAVVCHEVGHMLLGHDPQHGALLDQVLQGLAPAVSPDVAARFLAPATRALFREHTYSTPLEVDAEVVGTRLVAHLRRASSIGPDTASRGLR